MTPPAAHARRSRRAAAHHIAAAVLAAAAALCTALAATPLAAQPLPAASAPDAAASGATAAEAPGRAARETQDVTVQDERLLRAVLARYARVDGLRDVRVQVAAGVVILSGEVATDDDRERAVKLAREVPGVIDVDNQLALDTALAVRLRPALQRSQQLLQRLASALPLLVLSALVVWGMSAFGRWLGGRAFLLRAWAGSRSWPRCCARRCAWWRCSSAWSSRSI